MVGQVRLSEFEHVLALQVLQLRDSKYVCYDTDVTVRRIESCCSVCRFMPPRSFLAVGTTFQQKGAFHAESHGRLILLSIGMTNDVKKGAGGKTTTSATATATATATGTTKTSSAAPTAKTSTEELHYERLTPSHSITLKLQCILDFNAPCSSICQVRFVQPMSNIVRVCGVWSFLKVA